MKAFGFALALACLPQLSNALAASALAKAFSGKKPPVVVHLWDRQPSSLTSFAIDDVSEACRKAGATAVLVEPTLVKPFADEQETQRGSFPGPLPIIVDCKLSDLMAEPAELCAGAKNLGATGIGIRYYLGDYKESADLEAAMRGAVAAAEESGLTAILLGEFGADGDEGAAGASTLASSVGAAAALAERDATTDDGGALALSCWDGTEKELQRLREEGFAGLVLKNACNGDVGYGATTKSPSLAAQAVTKLVKAALSKGSSVWGGAGTTTGGESSGGSMEAYFNRS